MPGKRLVAISRSYGMLTDESGVTLNPKQQEYGATGAAAGGQPGSESLAETVDDADIPELSTKGTLSGDVLESSANRPQRSMMLSTRLSCMVSTSRRRITQMRQSTAWSSHLHSPSSCQA